MKNDSRRTEVIQSTSAPEPSVKEHDERDAHDMAITQKNHRIMRSISEKLHSRSSVSMPDLVRCDEVNVRNVSPIMSLQKGLEVSLEEESDECQSVESHLLINAPSEPNLSAFDAAATIQNYNKEEDQEEEIVQVHQPPSIKPRKNNVGASNTVEPEDILTEISNEGKITSIEIPPKSILKNGETSTHTNLTVHFINVHESITMEDEDYNAHNENDVWSVINKHREELERMFTIENVDKTSLDGERPPPLPITPPPNDDPEERDFSFAYT
jgi:hypothetical protein